MAVIKCKMCGGDLVIEPGATVAECEYCGTKQTIPNQDDEKKLTLFARANRLRMGCEFDKAAGIYESIVADFPQEAEAYWGLVLCKYGIEYVDDPATGKKIPTCHRSSFESIMEDSDFEQALENADVVARKVYRDEAKQIEEIRKGIIEVSGKEEPYDIFICYKETDENGQRTVDSVIAQDVYDALTEKGYRVFFSRITLEDKLGQEYEPYIFAALNSAKIMLAFGTDYEYYNAVWVKNEWSRYLKLMARDKTKHLIPCYKGIDAYDMPKEFAKLQAQDMGKVGAIQDLMRGIEKLLPRTKGGDSAQTLSAQSTMGETISATANSLLRRADIYLEDREWDSADAYFDRVLDMQPECAEAYLGKLLVELKMSKRTDLPKSEQDFVQNKNFEKAVRFGDATLKSELDFYLSQRQKDEQKLQEENEHLIVELRHQLETDQVVLDDTQRSESERLYKEADELKKAAEEAEIMFNAMPEQVLKKQLMDRRESEYARLSNISIFKGKEKKLIRDSIEEIEERLTSIEHKITVEEKALIQKKIIATQAKWEADSYTEKAYKQAKNAAWRKLSKLSGEGSSIDLFLREASSCERVADLKNLWNEYSFGKCEPLDEITGMIDREARIERLYGVGSSRIGEILDRIRGFLSEK
jgi:hypothetical protein